MEPFRDYDKYDGVGMAQLVASGQVHPIELVEAAIERIEASNDYLNAIVHAMYHRAREAAADDALPRGPLRGVPIVLKDLHAAYAGEPLTSSCRFLASYVPDRDSTVVARLKKAGLVAVAKTNTPEFGIKGVTEPLMRGPTRNPWNLDYTPGGSSGGSGAAVSAGIVPIGHGGDGGGSIRIPASCCGVFGLKPTRGRVPTGPYVGESWAGFDSDGFITRSVRDSAAILDACHGPDLGAPYHPPSIERPFMDEVGRDPGSLRIALTTESLYGKTTHPDCRAAVEDAGRLLAGLGHRVEEARPAIDREQLVRAYFIVVAASVALDIDRAAALMGRPATADQFEPVTWFFSQIGRTASAVELISAREAGHVAWRKIAPFFEEYDLLLTPTLPYPPLRIGEGNLKPAEAAFLRLMRAVPVKALMKKALAELGDAAIEKFADTMLFNMTGQPAMSVPLYWNAQGLPVGVQLAAGFGAEGTLLRVAAQLEQARPWKDRRPKRPEGW